MAFFVLLLNSFVLGKTHDGSCKMVVVDGAARDGYLAVRWAQSSLG